MIFAAHALAHAGAPVTVFSFGRSGTHLALDLMRWRFAAFDAPKPPLAPLDRLYVSLDPLAAGWGGGPHALATIARARRTLVKSHLWEGRAAFVDGEPALHAWLARGPTLFLVRHPEDAIGAVWALDHLQPGAAVNLLTGGADAYVEAHAARWAAQVVAYAGAARFRFEDVLADPQAAVARIVSFTGESARDRSRALPSPASGLCRARASRLLRRPASSAVVVPAAARARWRLEWTPARRAALWAHAGGAMRALGYAPRG